MKPSDLPAICARLFGSCGLATPLAAWTRRLRWGLALCGLLFGGLAQAQLLNASSVRTAHVQAELLAYAPQGVQAGATLWLGLQLDHQPGWHSYWKNAGDSGLPTELHWTLPPGLQAGAIQWPLPRKFSIGALANYGYQDRVLLPVQLQVGPDFQAPPLGQIEIQLQAQWLVCQIECVPEQGQFTLRLPVQGSSALHAAAFESAWAQQPQPLPSSARLSARIAHDSAAGSLQLELNGGPDAVIGQPLEVFVEQPHIIETGARWQQKWGGPQWQAAIPLAPYRSDEPQQLALLITTENENASRKGWRAELAVQGVWPRQAEAAALAPPSPRNAGAEKPPAGPPATALAPSLAGYAIALLGALLGGLLLNLMPCVFPVLALKAMGLGQQERLALRWSGLAYTLGVIASMLALAALMLLLRAGGQSLGWGFQLQSPWVVAGLAVLFTLLGLNLSGLFHFGTLAPSSLAARQLTHPLANALLSGMLTVAVASPCTAPFMGASLGYTLTLPAGPTLLLFAVMGLGLALPMLVLSLLPATARWLPRPGAWMETLRQFLAFPMFGTVIWLLWVLGQHSGSTGVAALLALLLTLALGLWALGQHGRARGLLIGGAGLLLLALASSLGPLVLRPSSTPAAAQHDAWQPWSAEREQQLLAEGRTLLVDYTAAWCITCQYNKVTTLSDPQVLAMLADAQVVLLRADWTRRDPAITASLAALGRNGVPVYALHRPGSSPLLLPEVLTASALRKAVLP
jgi:thiol:disulfide interchange protein/DsbC/DsbD-like thiol-disulfide interchange protein